MLSHFGLKYRYLIDQYLSPTKTRSESQADLVIGFGCGFD